VVFKTAIQFNFQLVCLLSANRSTYNFHLFES